MSDLTSDSGSLLEMTDYRGQITDDISVGPSEQGACACVCPCDLGLDWIAEERGRQSSFIYILEHVHPRIQWISGSWIG